MVDYRSFQELDVQILGIAATHPFSQKAFADSLNLPYPLLADYPNPDVIRSYGILRPHPKNPTRLVARRSFFLIDATGAVQGRWFVGDAIAFSNEPILERIRQISTEP